MADNANDEGFNKSGFRDIDLPSGLNQLGNKRLKIVQYCPAFNEKSESESMSVFSNVVISSKVGEKWNNLSFSLDDLELLDIRISSIVEALLKVGGANNGNERKAKG